MQLPRYIDSLPVGKFKKFLKNQGGQLLHETNEYEVIRLQCEKSVEILYRKQSGRLTWPKELVSAYIAYRSGGKIPWKATRKKKVNRKRDSVLIQTLFDRDGYECWYCAMFLTEPLATIEHLLNRSTGGNNHVNNLTIACLKCNQRASNMCITKKVKLRENIRANKKTD